MSGRPCTLIPAKTSRVPFPGSPLLTTATSRPLQPPSPAPIPWGFRMQRKLEIFHPPSPGEGALLCSGQVNTFTVPPPPRKLGPLHSLHSEHLAARIFSVLCPGSGPPLHLPAHFLGQPLYLLAHIPTQVQSLAYVHPASPAPTLPDHPALWAQPCLSQQHLKVCLLLRDVLKICDVSSPYKMHHVSHQAMNMPKAKLVFIIF